MKKKVIFIILHLAAAASAQQSFRNAGNLYFHSGSQVRLNGDFVNDGALVDSGSVVSLRGGVSQLLGGNVSSTFKNLELNNNSGAALNGNVNISRELKVAAGTFSSANYNLTLLSSQNGTARLAPLIGDYSGDLIMQRYIPASVAGWRFLASPVNNVTINDWQDNFITSGFPGSTYPNYNFTSVYSYDESVAGNLDNGYVSPASSSEALTPGKGFWCYLGSSATVVDVKGPPAKFAHTFSVTYTGSSGPLDDGWMLLGNPYPCAIDWDSPSWTRSKVNSAVYIWNPVKQQYATYISGIGVNGGSNIIPSSQAFWVQTSGNNPVLTCDENVKSVSQGSFLRPALLQQTFIKLAVVGNGFSDELFLRFANGMGNGFDGEFDARKFSSINPAVPTLSSIDSAGNNLSINNLPPIAREVSIPVMLKVGASGVYTLGIDSADLGPEINCIWLEDVLTGTRTSLQAKQTYSFFISDTTTAVRFYIRMARRPILELADATCNNFNGGKAKINANFLGKWKCVWKDAAENILRISAGIMSVDSLAGLDPGMYEVILTESTGACYSFQNSFEIKATQLPIAKFSILNDTIDLSFENKIVVQNQSLNGQFYRWNFGDHSPEENEFNPNAHVYEIAGEYSVTLIAVNGICTDTAIVPVVISDVVNGLNQRSFPGQFNVFPNPSKGVVHFKFFETENVTLDIFDLSGKLIFQLICEERDQFSSLIAVDADLSSVNSGIYLYKVSNGVSVKHSGFIRKE